MIIKENFNKKIIYQSFLRVYIKEYKNNKSNKTIYIYIYIYIYSYSVLINEEILLKILYIKLINNFFLNNC
jgi:hypothetical protein